MARPPACKKCRKQKRPKSDSFKKLEGYCECGAPSKLTEDTIAKLQQAFSIDATVAEATFYAGITETTYYRWAETNPQLCEQLERLRQKPVLTARQSVVQGLPNNPQFSFQYLKAKKPDEFVEKTKVEHSGKVETEESGMETDRAIAAVTAEYEEKLRLAYLNGGEKKAEEIKK